MRERDRDRGGISLLNIKDLIPKEWKNTEREIDIVNCQSERKRKKERKKESEKEKVSEREREKEKERVGAPLLNIKEHVPKMRQN